MSQVIQCPSCRKAFKAPDGVAGRKVRCSSCGEVFAAPESAEPESSMTDDLLAEAGQIRDDAPPADRGTPCPSCGKRMAADTILCMNCGFHTGLKRHVKKEKFEEKPETRRWLPSLDVHVMGIQLTPWTYATIALVIGIVIWWFTGPGQDTQLLEVRPVRVIHLLQGLSAAEPYSIMTGRGDTALGFQTPAGVKLPGGAAPISPDKVYTLGGGDGLSLVRPDDDGEHLAIRAQVAQRFLKKHERVRRTRVSLDHNLFRLTTAREPEKAIRPVFLLDQVRGAARIDLTAGQAFEHRRLLPPGIEPEEAELTRRAGGVSQGHLIFRGGHGVKGEVDFTSLYYASGAAPGVRGFTAIGQLQRRAPDGTSIHYRYAGSAVDVQWDGGQGWWIGYGYETQEALSPFTKHEAHMIFPRPPAGSGELTLWCGDEVVARFPEDYALRSDRPARVARDDPKPAPAPSGDSPGVSTPIPTPLDYLSAVGKARRKAMGLAVVTHMRQLGAAIQLYATQNGGALPDQLTDLRGEVGGTIRALLIHPVTKQYPGFVYRKPADRLGQVPRPPSTPLVHEALPDGSPDPDGAILYADGHVEFGKGKQPGKKD